MNPPLIQQRNLIKIRWSIEKVLHSELAVLIGCDIRPISNKRFEMEQKQLLSEKSEEYSLKLKLFQQYCLLLTTGYIFQIEFKSMLDSIYVVCFATSKHGF